MDLKDPKIKAQALIDARKMTKKEWLAKYEVPAGQSDWYDNFISYNPTNSYRGHERQGIPIPSWLQEEYDALQDVLKERGYEDLGHVTTLEEHQAKNKESFKGVQSTEPVNTGGDDTGGALYTGSRTEKKEVPDKPAEKQVEKQTDQKTEDAKSMSSKDWIEKYGGTFKDWKAEKEKEDGFTQAYNQARQEANAQGRNLSVAEFRQGLESAEEAGTTGLTNLTGDTSTPELPPPTDFTSVVDELAESVISYIPEDLDILRLTDDEIASIVRNVESEVGEEFTRLRERTEQDFDIALKTSQEELQKVFSQTAEDLPEAKKRQARNFQEAMADSQMALQNRQRTYSGLREVEEGKLGTSNRETLADLQKNVNRGLSDTQKQFEKLYGSGNMPQLSSVEGYTPSTGNVTGTEQINKSRTLEDLIRGAEVKKKTTADALVASRERSLNNLL